MASLTHVSMWSEAEHEWRKITASEAAKLYPEGTVFAHVISSITHMISAKIVRNELLGYQQKTLHLLL